MIGFSRVKIWGIAVGERSTGMYKRKVNWENTSQWIWSEALRGKFPLLSYLCSLISQSLPPLLYHWDTFNLYGFFYFSHFAIIEMESFCCTAWYNRLTVQMTKEFLLIVSTPVLSFLTAPETLYYTIPYQMNYNNNSKNLFSATVIMVMSSIDGCYYGVFVHGKSR